MIDEGRLLTDDEISIALEVSWGTNHERFQYVAKAQDAKTASILKKKYEADMKHLSHLIDDVIELEKKVKSKDAECQEKIKDAMRQRQSWLANVCGWRNPKQIELLYQARVDKLIASYTEYIEARKSDLTGMPSRSIPHSMALQVRRDTLDFALKAFLELANK